MTNIRLSDEDWSKIHAFLRQKSRACVGQDEHSCCFLEAVEVDEPERGIVAAGVWERPLAVLASDPDTEQGMSDATMVRAHPCTAGAQKLGRASPRSEPGRVQLHNPPHRRWLRQSRAGALDCRAMP